MDVTTRLFPQETLTGSVRTFIEHEYTSSLFVYMKQRWSIAAATGCGHDSRVVAGPAARDLVLDVAKRLFAISQTSRGPLGKGVWVGNSSNGVRSNCSSTIFEKCAALREDQGERNDPVLRVALQLLAAQERSHGDAGLLAAQIAGCIIIDAHERDLSPQALRVGLEWALTQCASFLERCRGNSPLRKDIPLSDRDSLLSLIQSSLTTKHVSIAWNPCTSESEHIAKVLLKGFLASLNVDRQGQLTSGLKLVMSQGCPILSSEALPGQILLDIPLPPTTWNLLQQSQEGGGGDVILFNTSLMLNGDVEEVGFSVETEAIESSAWTIRDAEVDFLTKLADRLSHIPKAKVRYIISQKLIHPWLRMHLLDKGIVAIERISAVHLAAVQELTGAHIFASAMSIVKTKNTIDPGLLGTLSRAEAWRSGTGKRLLRLYGNPQKGKKISTALLCAPDEPAVDELRHVANRSIVMLKAFLRKPFLLAGAGATEFALAADLRQSCTHTAPSRAHKIGAEIFARALESSVQALQPMPVSTGAITGLDVLENLSLHPFSGWNPKEEKSIDPWSCGIVDSGPAKICAFQLAIQTATVLFGLGSIVHEQLPEEV